MAKTINQQKIQELENLKDKWAEAKKQLLALEVELKQKELELKSKRQSIVEDGRSPIEANKLTSDLFEEVKQLRNKIKHLNQRINSYKDKYKYLEKWTDSVRFYLTFKNLYENGKTSFWKLKKLLGLENTTIYVDVLDAYIRAVVEKVGDFKKAIQEYIYHNWNAEEFKHFHKEMETKIEQFREEFNNKVANITDREQLDQLQKQFKNELKEILKKEALQHIKV